MSGSSPLLDVAVCCKSSNTEACHKKLPQIIANNITNVGGQLVSEFMWGIVALVTMKKDKSLLLVESLNKQIS